jgi:hypothetical protein
MLLYLITLFPKNNFLETDCKSISHKGILTLVFTDVTKKSASALVSGVWPGALQLR